MMKFVITQVVEGGGRLGRLSHIGGHGNTITMETPSCLLYTKGGAIPNVTSEVAFKLEGRPPITHVTTQAMIKSSDVLAEFGKGLASFTGNPDVPVYLSVQDPTSPAPTGFNETNVVSVWNRNGRYKLSPESYMSFVESCQPFIFEALSDGDTPQGSKTKRIRKSIDLSLKYLDKCIEIWRSSEKLKSAALLGVLQGGDMLSQRTWCAKEIAKRPVSGFVFDGFYEGAMESSARWSLLTEVMAQIPADKLRVLPRSGRPDEVLKAVEYGMDVFDSAFPHQVTDRGCALVFNFHQKNSSCVPPETVEESVPDLQTNKPSALEEPATDSPTNKPTEPSNKKCVTTDNQSELKDKENGADKKTCYEMDLREARFFDDFRPVLPGCSCYCCQNHTRAYINHLLNTKELLANVLLTVHNLHHYFAFFQAIRDSLAKGTFKNLVKIVCEQR